MKRDTQDRLTHAALSNDDLEVELVRYDKQGRWYVEEYIDGFCVSRVRMKTTGEAVERALEIEGLGGMVRTGLPGGRHFDYKVESAKSKRARNKA